jgi:hypothetical protein
MRGNEQLTFDTRLNGTLNLVTPAIDTPPGDAIAGVNYLPHERGYQRIPGFERLDGQPKPSQATYYILNFDAGSAAITEGQTVTGATSGATGKALIDAVVSTGTYGASTAAGYLVLTTVSGTFQDNENLQVSAVTKSVANGVATERGASTDALDTTYYRDAIETARALIQKPTGTGGILGVWMYGGTPYCVRNNTTGKLYKATTSGWTAQALGSYLKFDAGTAAFAAGQTVTGGSSTHTATIVRVVVRTGTTGDGDQTGLLIVSGASGTFTNNEIITSATGSATADGTVTAATLPSTGHYDFTNHNFFGASNLQRMYGTSGQGPAFEWDGSVFVPLFTGMTTDTPKHLATHGKVLLLAFPGGSLQTSGLGDPYAYDPVTGASEIGMGHDITGLIQDMAGATIVLGRNHVAALYGTSTEDMVLKSLSDDEGGAIEWTAQRVGSVIYMDDRGLRDVNTTTAFGDFKKGTLSRLIAPLFELKRADGITPVASVRLKNRDEYRVFFSDGTGIACYMGGKKPRFMPFDLGVNVTCACSGEDSVGNEVVLVGTDEGWVFQLEAGTSFDGEEVDAYIRLAFNHCGSPGLNKRFHKATIEGDFPAGSSIAAVTEYDYGDPNRPPVTQKDFTIYGSGGFWDEMFWNDFVWDSMVEGRAESRLSGRGRNASVAAISAATYEDPHILHGVTLAYTPRQLVR